MAAPDSTTIELRGVTLPGAERGAAGAEGLSFKVLPGEVIWLSGESGGRREALFRVLSLGVRPEAGEVWVEGSLDRSMSAEERARVRSHRFGFVSASPFLLPSFSAIENVAVPLLKISPVTMEEARVRIQRVLEFTGLTPREESRAEELSSFDQMRLALARALATGPAALFIEDLAARLSAAELLEFFSLIREAAARFGVAVIALTGQLALAVAGERSIELVQGGIRTSGGLLANQPL